jgi:membrane fusion protein (multidrug efflux system)
LVQRGESIREGTHAVTIVQLNPLKLQTAVQEKYANVIRPNLEVKFRVEPFPEETFIGRVTNISPSISQESRTFPVEILVENPTRRLKPGFFAKGAILTNMDEDVMAVPQSAISVLAGVSSVFVIEEGIVRQQTVTLGTQEGMYYEIVDGLEGDELLAASNLNQIVTGTRVVAAGEEGRRSPGDEPAGNSDQRTRPQGGPPQGGTE